MAKSLKQKFLLYTNPNNVTNRAYVAIGTCDVKSTLRSAAEYPDSYRILYQGKGDNTDIQNSISEFRAYNFGNVTM
jgi:hypothetical protein